MVLLFILARRSDLVAIGMPQTVLFEQKMTFSLVLTI
jgi:hypothetical protein